MRGVVTTAWTEGDHDVGVALLGLDEPGCVVLAHVELTQDLVGGVAAPRAVALELPGAAKVVRRRQEHANVMDGTQRLGVEVQEALDDQEGACAQIDGSFQGAASMVIDRLEDALAPPQLHELLGQHIKMIGHRVKRGDIEPAPLRPVKAVIVIGADASDVVLSPITRMGPRDRVVLPAPESPTTPRTIGRPIDTPYGRTRHATSSPSRDIPYSRLRATPR